MKLLETIAEGPRLSVSTPLETVQAAAKGPRLVLEFEGFRDGRGFSLAASLRARGYAGELVAAGAVLPDQARHLARSGFDAVELGQGDPAPWRRMLAAFSVVYQPANDPAVPAWRRRAGGGPAGGGRAPDAQARAETLALELTARLGEAAPSQSLRAVIERPDLRVAVLSSFGAESATLLHLVAEVDPATPVLFLETGQHFLQTLQYRRELEQRLGLTDVRIVVPDAHERADVDPGDDLWRRDPDACCDLRKVRPLARASAGFDVLVTGRKRRQATTRRDLAVFEALDGHLRLNPLAAWSEADVAAYAQARDLPSHPLVAQGYASIGCWPCTRPVETGEDARAGRWSGRTKVECGIHLPRAPSVTARRAASA